MTEERSSPEIEMEPIINSGEPKWLFIKKEEIIPLVHDRSAEQSIKEPLDPEIKITFSTQDAGLWRCNKCNGTVTSEKKPDYCINCERNATFENITKNINPDLWKLPQWKDIPVEDLDMLGVYNDMLALVKRCIIFPEEIYYKIFTLWIISSWKVESWNAVGFLIFRGLIESGKTRALDILRELGYRMMHTSGVSFPAMVRASHNWKAGILLDEIDNKVDRRTESGRDMIDFLKPSYRKGSTYTVAHKDDQDEIKTYRNFGFKAFAGEKGGYDRAMFSRAIDFQMEQDYPEIAELTDVQYELDMLQTKLLNYRYKTDNPPELNGSCKLKGRDREIFSVLIRTGTHIGIKTDDLIEFVQMVLEEKKDEIKNSDEYLILSTIKNHSIETLDDAPEVISYNDICERCGWDSDSKQDQKKRQKLGYIFKKKLIFENQTKKQWNRCTFKRPKEQTEIKFSLPEVFFMKK
ncbi:hypothetical protein KA005_36045, partial [bacterium]|nr:hypothetical protein [bacterium]